MPNTTHTPGPWTDAVVPGRDRRNHSIVTDPNGTVLVDLGLAYAQTQYDAALIAAAPALLEALEALLDGGIADPSVVAQAHAAVQQACGGAR